MSRSEDFDLADQTFPSDLRLGMLRLQNADKLPLSSAFIDMSGSEGSLTLRGDVPEPWAGVSLVSIRMFKFPAGRKEFQRQVEFFGRNRKARARLPDSVAFSPAQLAVGVIPDGWTHEAYPRSGRDFIHIYQSPKRAVLIRWLAKDGTILDHPLLQQVRASLSFDPGQWITKFPVFVPRRRAAKPLTDSRLPADVAAEIREATARARTRLKLGRVKSSDKTIAAIAEAIDALRAQKRVPAEEKRQLAVDLGSLWGETLCTAAGWQWRCIQDEGENATYAVASPSRSHVIEPLRVLHTLVTSPRQANNSALLFNMVTAGDLPQSPKRGYCWLA